MTYRPIVVHDLTPFQRAALDRWDVVDGAWVCRFCGGVLSVGEEFNLLAVVDDVMDHAHECGGPDTSAGGGA